MSSLSDLLAAALEGENTCLRCGCAIPVTAEAVAFVAACHDAGELGSADPTGVRMLLLLGSVDAGCGITSRIEAGTPRASCPDCATPAELARAATMSGGRQRKPAAASSRFR